jgi:hypothetical protein
MAVRVATIMTAAAMVTEEAAMATAASETEECCTGGGGHHEVPSRCVCRDELGVRGSPENCKSHLAISSAREAPCF